MSDKKPRLENKDIQKTHDIQDKSLACSVNPDAMAEEKGGFKDAGLKEPTRFGDWEVNGRCSDF